MTLPLMGEGYEQTETTGDDRYTPKWVFEELGVTFEMDVAAPPSGPWRDQTNVPAHRYVTKAEDGLATEWTGIVWCNPPYSDPSPWVHKMIDHNDGILLAPIASNGAWMQLAMAHADALAPLIGIKFTDGDGGQAGIPIAVGLYGFGHQAVMAIAQSEAWRTWR